MGDHKRFVRLLEDLRSFWARNDRPILGTMTNEKRLYDGLSSISNLGSGQKLLPSKMCVLNSFGSFPRVSSFFEVVCITTLLRALPGGGDPIQL